MSSGSLLCFVCWLLAIATVKAFIRRQAANLRISLQSTSGGREAGSSASG
ncbi:MAG: hypothetical protein F6K22_23440 [Okeania sp. SIO2F4]|nr:hypothetical protein [Okeania sp. SIO2F4]NES05505.1 hypothetical protein [Okeania sp. SIO2F4]